MGQPLWNLNSCSAKAHLHAFPNSRINWFKGNGYSLCLPTQPWLLLEWSYRNLLLLSSSSVFLPKGIGPPKCVTGRNESKFQILLLVLSRDCPYCPQGAGSIVLKGRMFWSLRECGFAPCRSPLLKLWEENVFMWYSAMLWPDGSESTPWDFKKPSIKTNMWLWNKKTKSITNISEWDERVNQA